MFSVFSPRSRSSRRNLINVGRQRGMTLVTVGLSLTAMFGISSLAVDMGKLYLVRTQLQHAADAGALAGAYVLTQPWWGAGMTTAAQNAAVAVANSNHTINGQVAITAANVTVNLVNRTVSVQAAIPGGGLVLNFAKAVGVGNLNVSARAMAHASTSAAGGGVRCLRPFYIPNSAIAPSGVSSTTACNNNQTLVYHQGLSNAGQLTSYAQTYFSSPTAQVTIKYAGGSAPTPSQYGLLGLAGQGASSIQCTIQSCTSQCGTTTPYRCGDVLPLATGSKTGPIKTGVDTLIGTPSQDLYLGPGRYQSQSTGVISDTSNSLVTVGVWDDCTQSISPGKSGSNPNAVGFMQIFITGISGGGDITGYLVSASGCTDVGGGGFGTGWGAGTGTTGPGGIPIQLVQ